MKKLLIIFFVLMLITAMSTAVMADEAVIADTGTAVTDLAEADTFFTWDTLATYAGALMAVVLMTQVLKDVPIIRKLPTRLLSYIIALLVLIIATLFTTGFEWSTIFLCAFNAFIVALAANGGYDGLTHRLN